MRSLTRDSSNTNYDANMVPVPESVMCKSLFKRTSFELLFWLDGASASSSATGYKLRPSFHGLFI